MKIKILKPCIDQDTKHRLTPGDIVELSDFERGRHLAEGNAIPYVEEVREVQVMAPPEVRVKPNKENTASFFKRRGRPKK